MTTIDMGRVQTLTLAGERFVLLPEAEFVRLTGEPPEPALPPPNERGNYAARELTRAVMARDIIQFNLAAPWAGHKSSWPAAPASAPKHSIASNKRNVRQV
jgi:hypothetical protein